ncbi:hypothetical protein GUJ93_ZPchr0006g45193 [Zizania palustris]|uniref:Uncharacterized protein n=1 Tax=Zizania palustris TaxID=103762 RepID=A0A8J5W306_ZIZPA|nr:hypothetical protein GUJ93_ZPchr0006g45193 [Zizania palustris]
MALLPLAEVTAPATTTPATTAGAAATTKVLRAATAKTALLVAATDRTALQHPSLFASWSDFAYKQLQQTSRMPRSCP